jgi:hypothetical protein
MDTPNAPFRWLCPGFPLLRLDATACPDRDGGCLGPGVGMTKAGWWAQHEVTGEGEDSSRSREADPVRGMQR